MYKTKYQENCEQYHKDIVDRFEVAKSVDKFWTKDEIQTLLEYQFQNAKRVKAQFNWELIKSPETSHIKHRDLEVARIASEFLFKK